MSKHTFTIEAEFDSGSEYERFIAGVSALGGEVVDETSDFDE